MRLRRLLLRIPLDIPLFRSSQHKGEFDAIDQRKAFNKVAAKWQQQDLQGKSPSSNHEEESRHGNSTVPRQHDP